MAFSKLSFMTKGGIENVRATPKKIKWIRHLGTFRVRCQFPCGLCYAPICGAWWFLCKQRRIQYQDAEI